MGRWAGLRWEENVPGRGLWPDRLGAGPTATPMGVLLGWEGIVGRTGSRAALGTWSLFPVSPREKLTSASQLPEIGLTEPSCLAPLFKQPWQTAFPYTCPWIPSGARLKAKPTYQSSQGGIARASG